MNLYRSLFASVCLASVCSGCTALVDQFSGRGEACQILASGKPATATIVDINDTGVTINNNPVVGFVLEVKPDHGPAFRAKTEALINNG